LLVLAGMLVLAVFEAYWPFHWDPPGTVTNEVRRTAGGALTFGDRNAARTAGTPPWVATVRRTGRVDIELVARPAYPQHYPDTSIMMLASNSWNTDFALGQDGEDLLLWLRRTGTDTDGDPAYFVANAFPRGRWADVRVTVRDDRLRVTVDGATRLRERIRPGSLSAWGPGLMVLGDEVHGGRPWQGEIRKAVVRTDAGTVDYTRPGALQTPRRYFYLPDHVSPFPPFNRTEWFALVVHLVSFVPVGILLVWIRRRRTRRSTEVLVAVAIALGIAAVLAGGKLLFSERHLAVADLVVQAAGAFVGAYAATWWRARRKRPPTGSGRRDLVITERRTYDEIR
jgi:VanZ family protein